MAETIITIQQGEPITAAATVTFLGTGSAGDPAACRRLVFPASVSALLAPILYSAGPRGQCMNPDRTFNLDNLVLPHPFTSVVPTIGGTRVVRQETALDDVVVTEVWLGEGGLSMPTPLFRLLYEYLTNGSLIGPADALIQWEPRDRTDRIYSVEMLSFSVGGGDGENRFDVTDVGGLSFDSTGNEDWNGVDAGFIDREVRLRMRIVADVTP